MNDKRPAEPALPISSLRCIFCGKTFVDDVAGLSERDLQVEEIDHMVHCHDHPLSQLLTDVVYLRGKGLKTDELLQEARREIRRLEEITPHCQCGHCGAKIDTDPNLGMFEGPNRAIIEQHAKICPARPASESAGRVEQAAAQDQAEPPKPKRRGQRRKAKS